MKIPFGRPLIDHKEIKLVNDVKVTDTHSWRKAQHLKRVFKIYKLQ